MNSEFHATPRQPDYTAIHQRRFRLSAGSAGCPPPRARLFQRVKEFLANLLFGINSLSGASACPAERSGAPAIRYI